VAKKRMESKKWVHHKFTCMKNAFKRQADIYLEMFQYIPTGLRIHVMTGGSTHCLEVVTVGKLV